MKKIIALLLAVIMILAMAACAPKTETKTEDQQKDASNASASNPEGYKVPEAPKKDEEKKQEEQKQEEEKPYLPLVEPGSVTMTVGVQQKANTVDYEDNDQTKWWEEQTGINFDIVYFSSDSTEAREQFALMVSAGEKLPDILWGFGALSGSYGKEYGEDGYLVDLLPYYESDAAHFFWDSLEEWITPWIPQDAANILAYGLDANNGAMYGMPNLQVSFGGDLITLHPMINQAWLDKLGLPYPETVEQLHDALLAFTTQDPNGNGIADEMGLVGGTHTRATIMEWVINAYVFCSDKYFFNVDNGEIWVPYTTDEYRQALIELKKWNEEGLISPLSFTISKNEDLIPLMSPVDDVSVAGVIAGHPTLIVDAGAENTFEYKGLKMLKDATGSGRGGYTPKNANALSYTTFITSDCEDPELAFRALDVMMTQEGMFAQRYGVEGRDWEWVEWEGKAYDEDGARYLNVIDNTAFSGQNSITYHNYGPGLVNYECINNIHDWVTGASKPGEAIDWNDTSIEWSVRKSEWQWEMVTSVWYSGAFKDEMVQTLVYNADENAVITELKSPLLSKIKEYRALFITGQFDPANDADWEEYLNTLDVMGLDEITAATQSCWDRMTGK